MSNKEWLESFKRYVYFPKTKLDYWTFRKLRSLKSKAVGDKGWNEWFKYLTRDVNLHPSLHERVSEGTTNTLLPIWMMNYADNLDFIRYGDKTEVKHPLEYHQQTIADLMKPLPILEIDPEFEKTDGPVAEYNDMKVKNPPETSAIIVGRGPSLFKHGHLPMLANAIKNGEYTGLVVASDGGLISCLEAGVLPDVVVTVDGAPVIKKYFDHPLVREYGNKIKWIVAVTVNHDVYLAGRDAGLQPYWFHPMFDDWRQNESWTRIQVLMSRTKEYERGVPRANVGGNAGTFAWIAAMEIFKRSPIALIGIDFGYPEDTKLEETQYYPALLKEAKGDVGLVRSLYQEFFHSVWKQKAYVDPVFYHYRQAFLEMNLQTTVWYRHYGGTYNCTEGGTLYGSGITCIPLAQFLKEHPK